MDAVGLPFRLTTRGVWFRPTFLFEPGQLTVQGRKAEHQWVIPRADLDQVVWHSATGAAFRDPVQPDERPLPKRWVDLGRGSEQDVWLWFSTPQTAPRWLRRELLRRRLLLGLALQGRTVPYGSEWRHVGLEAVQLRPREDRITAKRVLEAWGCRFPETV